MNCYLSRNYKGLSSAGNKAKTDIEQIMKDLSFKNVGLKQTTYRNKVLSFLFTLAGVLKAFLPTQRRLSGASISVKEIFHLCLQHGPSKRS